MSPCARQVVVSGVWRHRIEVTVSPARAQIYFHDERWIDPINTQMRFEVAAYNTDRGAAWSVVSPSGGPGLGTIDQTGLYQAPDKGSIASGATDIVVATARADPLRKAFAWVTLVGEGPAPAPEVSLDVWPRLVTLYHWSGNDNAYMDDSNKLQVFRAFPRHAANPAVNWSLTAGPGTLQLNAADSAWCTYLAPNTGASPGPASATIATITARLAADPGVTADAEIVLLNYAWPNY
jgi:hypothetical protein